MNNVKTVQVLCANCNCISKNVYSYYWFMYKVEMLTSSAVYGNYVWFCKQLLNYQNR